MSVASPSNANACLIFPFYHTEALDLIDREHAYLKSKRPNEQSPAHGSCLSQLKHSYPEIGWVLGCTRGVKGLNGVHITLDVVC